MEAIGKDVVRSLKIIPAKFVVHEDWYMTFACKSCPGKETEEDTGKTQIRKAPRVSSVYPGSNCSPAAVAYLMTQQYGMGSPLYRMEMDISRSGYPLSRQTMFNWMIHCSETWLTTLYKELHQQLLQKEIIHAGETE